MEKAQPCFHESLLKPCQFSKRQKNQKKISLDIQLEYKPVERIPAKRKGNDKTEFPVQYASSDSFQDHWIDEEGLDDSELYKY